MVERVIAFQSASGKVFDNIGDAADDEAKYMLRGLLGQDHIGQGGEWNAEMFFDWLVKRQDEVHAVLQMMSKK